MIGTGLRSPLGVLGAGLFLTLCAGFVWASGRGFDPNDEAFYLIHLNDPRAYAAVTDFAHLWSGPFHWLGGDIAAIRIAGAVALLACGLTFAAALLAFTR